MTIDLPKIALLGAGSMSGAILDGMLAGGVPASTFAVTTRSETSAAALRETGIGAVAAETDAGANKAAVADAGVVVIGVKPFAVADLVREIADELAPGTVVISVAVGVTTATIEALVPAHVRVVRALPNTPIGVGHGVTGISAGARADTAAVAIASAVFAISGDVLPVQEARLDALSAVSGSGPAYVFLLIEEWQRAAEAIGFSPAEAETMVRGTLRGAIALLDASGREPEDLRRAVTSPKGTTERAVAVLQEARLADVLERAETAAIARAEELAAL